MTYNQEELVPIVAKLAEKYTSKESTSITYEKAQQLMEAVIYCIHECELDEKFSLLSADGISAQKMYEIGIRRVEEKVRETLKVYNEMMSYFSSYENACLYDTVVKGLPEFFKWYDCKYEPQNTILTLDYPLLLDISQYTGIDKIHDFVLCIQVEQKFLKKFSSSFIMKILSKYNKNYKSMIDNLCEVVLMNVVSHILSGEKLEELQFEPKEYEHMQALLQTETLSDLRIKIKKAIERLVREHYENDEYMLNYLYKAVDNISVHMKNAADSGNLHYLF